MGFFLLHKFSKSSVCVDSQMIQLCLKYSVLYHALSNTSYCLFLFEAEGVKLESVSVVSTHFPEFIPLFVRSGLQLCLFFDRPIATANLVTMHNRAQSE